VGAAPIQNIGAYGQELAQTITRLRAYDRLSRSVCTLTAKECAFAYRDSTFRSRSPDRYVVLDVTFQLRKGDPDEVTYPELAARLGSTGMTRPTLDDIRRSVLALRREKAMVLDATDPNRRSCGSFFVNPIVPADDLPRVERRAASVTTMPRYPLLDGRTKLSAAWLIERAGFTRGLRRGAVGLSTRHALAVVCHEGARSADVIAFARDIRDRVRERFGVVLAPEPVLWGFPEATL
jgi:UDP-N-acetylmuramate dehydrogenase